MGDPNTIGTRKLVLFIKCAYWIALAIIAVMAMASYLLLQGMLAAHQKDQSLLSLVSTQKALSQRIVFLAKEAEDAPERRKAELVAALRTANAGFERNYDRLLSVTGVDAAPPVGEAADALAPLFFGRPHHLDYFSVGLAANGWRLIAALEQDLSGLPLAGASSARERAELDETVATATMAGYLALEDVISGMAQRRAAAVLRMHKVLFFATIGVIVLVTLLIFRPMAAMIRRRTSELVEAKNSMAFIAVHDGLTGLYNRTFLHNHFDTLLKAARRRGESLAVLQLDLDRFKQINDTLGHPAGDYVLVKTAERMRASCRASDLCARLGGDEFVMVLSGAGTWEDINLVAKRILDNLNQPLDYEGVTIQPGASAGIAVFPLDADNASDLLVHADLALYAAKKTGGGGFSFFSDELRAELEHRKQLEADLRETIAARGFTVHYQPQVSLVDRRVTGVEALVRWRHPERGMIAPGTFIPVAERCGLMAEIGRLVMEKALADAACWHRAGIAFGRLAINVSGSELREPDFSGFLFQTLEETGLPADKLSLEIVESVILDDEKTGIAAKLRRIRAAGVHLELDDFGTGYASLSHVNPNEIDRLKIDRRFVQRIDANGDNTKIVRAITELARGLGIAIIAEGAETEAELTSLLAIGCEQVQGYSVAFPMPEAEARQWMAARMPKARLVPLRAGGGR
ncbi:EAL domain-containing protein [Aquibium sp. A9E412]|uniref:putative bifunctional diguanylate cyclase/phosphodiesterase n=1 Tax=Aquibium sp. A9E412 TaxID=2976767 RepID=UPI0025AFDACD|nr:EAL domain-containing protein [Aquibium sp. A9E412]MDN2566239.1 EAL domain-containing protein [Aquibium sp. A9E412]